MVARPAVSLALCVVVRGQVAGDSAGPEINLSGFVEIIFVSIVFLKLLSY